MHTDWGYNFGSFSKANVTKPNSFPAKDDQALPFTQKPEVKDEKGSSSAPAAGKSYAENPFKRISKNFFDFDS